jgi:hypothetical protein
VTASLLGCSGFDIDDLSGVFVLGGELRPFCVFLDLVDITLPSTDESGGHRNQFSDDIQSATTQNNKSYSNCVDSCTFAS